MGAGLRVNLELREAVIPCSKHITTPFKTEHLTEYITASWNVDSSISIMSCHYKLRCDTNVKPTSFCHIWAMKKAACQARQLRV